MQTAWRERDPEARIKSAQEALSKNADCAPAYILLAEEKAKSIVEAEKILKEGLRAAEVLYRKSQLTHHMSPQLENQHRRDHNLAIYIRRRLAMCARKMGRLKEAIKMMRDIVKECPLGNLFNIHENLIEALLEAQAYADVQALLAKYEGDFLHLFMGMHKFNISWLYFSLDSLEAHIPKSSTIIYTSALLKARNIGEKFSPELIAKRGLSMAEMHAVEAIHRAVEYNPHIPKYLLETKKLILPAEHMLRRSDSEAIAYTFFHLAHWKRVDGAINLLDCTWKGSESSWQLKLWLLADRALVLLAFRIIPYPMEKGHLFYPYPECSECTDRELLPGLKMPLMSRA